jgi:hypothetical protein
MMRMRAMSFIPSSISTPPEIVVSAPSKKYESRQAGKAPQRRAHIMVLIGSRSYPSLHHKRANTAETLTSKTAASFIVKTCHGCVIQARAAAHIAMTGQSMNRLPIEFRSVCSSDMNEFYFQSQ